MRFLTKLKDSISGWLYLYNPQMAVDKVNNSYLWKELEPYETTIFLDSKRCWFNLEKNLTVYESSSEFHPWEFVVLKIFCGDTTYNLDMSNIDNPYWLTVTLTPNKMTTVTFLANTSSSLEIFDVKVWNKTDLYSVIYPDPYSASPDS